MTAPRNWQRCCWLVTGVTAPNETSIPRFSTPLPHSPPLLGKTWIILGKCRAEESWGAGELWWVEEWKPGSRLQYAAWTRKGNGRPRKFGRWHLPPKWANNWQWLIGMANGWGKEEMASCSWTCLFQIRATCWLISEDVSRYLSFIDPVLSGCLKNNTWLGAKVELKHICREIWLTQAPILYSAHNYEPSSLTNFVGRSGSGNWLYNIILVKPLRLPQYEAGGGGGTLGLVCVCVPPLLLYDTLVTRMAWPKPFVKMVVHFESFALLTLILDSQRDQGLYHSS